MSRAHIRMSGKNFDKRYLLKTPEKRQVFITKYISCDSPRKSTNVLKQNKSKSQEFKKHNGKGSSPLKIRIDSKSPILQKWLQKYGENNVGIDKKSNNNKIQTIYKVKLKKMNVENLPSGSPFDKLESKKRLAKLKYYALRIAKYDEHRKIIEEVEEMEKRIVSPTFLPGDSPQKIISVLDCTDMTKIDIINGLYENLEYLKDIANERIYSKRHKMYKSERKDNLSMNSLSYNVSMIAFTLKQKEILSKKLNKLFGQNIDYQMKVLLPELCLKIFMDRYNMGYDEAYQYLEECPVKNVNRKVPKTQDSFL